MNFSGGHYFFVPLVLKTELDVLSLVEVMTSESGGVRMTDNQKKLVQIYREKGMSSKKVADTLSVSINTIKTFCKRNGLGGVRMAASGAKDVMVTSCRCCGKPVRQNPGRKQKRFCSDACRNRWWNSHLEDVDKKANYERICECCGKTFISYGNSNRKYCSHSCYVNDRFGGGEDAGE